MFNMRFYAIAREFFLIVSHGCALQSTREQTGMVILPDIGWDQLAEVAETSLGSWVPNRL